MNLAFLLYVVLAGCVALLCIHLTRLLLISVPRGTIYTCWNTHFGGFAIRTKPYCFGLCLGWIAFTFVPFDIEDHLGLYAIMLEKENTTFDHFLSRMANPGYVKKVLKTIDAQRAREKFAQSSFSISEEEES